MGFLLILLLLVSCTGERKVPTEPRYVITSPEVGEIIHLLQGVKFVVGVTAEVDYPADYQQITKVGNFGAVNREKIISLNPTLVFVSGLEQEHLAFELEKAGIKTISVYPATISELLAGIVEISRSLGSEERGIAVADSLQYELEKLRYQGRERPRVYLEIYNNPIMSVSKRSFIGELIELAGGDNIFVELPRDYSRVKAEDVITANPEIIILTYPGITAHDIKTRMGWQNISACRENRIYGIEEINPDLILRAGPRIIEGVSKLQELLGSTERVER